MVSPALVDCLFRRVFPPLRHRICSVLLASFVAGSALIARDDNGPLFHSVCGGGVEAQSVRPSVRSPHTLAIVRAIQAHVKRRTDSGAAGPREVGCVKSRA